MSDMFDWIVTRNEAIARIHKNVFDNENLKRTHPTAIAYAREHFLEFCLFVLTSRGESPTSDVSVEVIVKGMREKLEGVFGARLFEYRVHAAYWISSSIREKRIEEEIDREIESREFLRSLPREFKIAWLVSCATSDLPPKIKLRISPIVKPYEKHRAWIEDRVVTPVSEASP